MYKLKKTTMSETAQYIQKLAETNDKQAIRQKLYKQGILSSYSPDDGRIICYTSKNDRFRTIAPGNMWGECNGFIYDIEQKKALVIPTYSCKTHVNTQIINSNISNDKYDIYKINDGTIINLYYYEPEGKWEISTTRGYKMSEQSWDGMTYTEMVNKSITRSHNMSFKTLCDKLDKNLCYTFGFKHPHMHPFREGSNHDVYNFWFIQSVNPENSNFHNLPRDLHINVQEKIDNVNNIKILYGILKRSLEIFKSSGQVNYGFILRRNDCIVNDNIILESALMQKVRHMVYSKSVRSHFANSDSTNLRGVVNYFNINTKSLYLQLFPQDNDIYTLVDKYIKIATSDIMNKIEKKEVSQLIPEWFINHIQNYISNTYNSSDSLEKYIQTLIYNPNYIKLFHSLINSDLNVPNDVVS